ncbi:hypothetical protein M0R45_028364 [Rubus argutus]|uniref:Uncharacterized protein n=1 Tax=Rubus argutus TaxID=59490 RepID=A0AAW1W4G6_RUBAR
MEETDSTSSEGEELTAQEKEQLNDTLAGLGVPNVVTDATPVSMAFKPPPEARPENPTEETDPDSALIVHGLELLHQATEVVADQNRLEEVSDAFIADADTPLPQRLLLRFRTYQRVVKRPTLRPPLLRVHPYQKLLKPWRTSRKSCSDCGPREVPNGANALAQQTAPEPQANELEAVRIAEQIEPTTEGSPNQTTADETRNDHNNGRCRGSEPRT